MLGPWLCVKWRSIRQCKLKAVCPWEYLRSKIQWKLLLIISWYKDVHSILLLRYSQGIVFNYNPLENKKDKSHTSALY